MGHNNNYTDRGTFSLLKGSSYYRPIKRTDDLTHIHNGRSGTKLAQSKIYIAPSIVPLDVLAAKALDELSTELNRLSVPPVKNDLLSQPVAKILALYLGEGQHKDLLKNELQQLGMTGVLTQASQKLNTALGDEDRFILSRTGILMYAAYRAVVGFEVKDVDGIMSNILSSVDLIKAYINQLLVDRVIEQQNLKVEEAHRLALKARLGNINMSYTVGTVVPKVLEEFKKVKNDRGLSDEVYAFLTSGEIDLPYGVDINTIAENMVSYLVDTGYKHDNTDVIGQRIDEKLGVAKTEIEDQFNTRIEGVETNIQTRMDEKVDQLKDNISTDISARLEEAQNTIQASLTTQLEEANKALETQLIQKVKELVAIEIEQGTEIEQGAEEIEQDDLSEIKGIAKTRIRILKKAGITTFRQLANLKEIELKEILGPATNLDYKNIINQAKAKLIK